MFFTLSIDKHCTAPYSLLSLHGLSQQPKLHIVSKVLFHSLPVRFCWFLYTSVFLCHPLSISFCCCLFLSAFDRFCLFLSGSFHYQPLLSVSVRLFLFLSISLHCCPFLSVSVGSCLFPFVSDRFCPFLPAFCCHQTCKMSQPLQPVVV